MSQIDTTESQFEPVHEQPGWPKTIGIISIVWGSLGAACSLCGTAYFIAAPSLMKMGEQQFGPAPDVLKPPLLGTALVAFGMLLAGLLIFAGVMVLRRRPVGRMMHLLYAVLSLVSTGVGVVVQLGSLKTMKEWVAANPDNKWASQMHPEMQLPIMAFTTLLAIAWPLFCIIWFGMIKSKPTDMGVAQPKDII